MVGFPDEFDHFHSFIRVNQEKTSLTNKFINMKKNIILFASVLFSIQIQAQVKVGSNGNMMVHQTTGTPKAFFSVGCIGDSLSVMNLANIGITPNYRDCLNIYNIGGNSQTGRAVTLYNEMKRYGSNTGIYTYPSINYSYGEAYGIRSIAGNSATYNCGVFGGVVTGCTDGQITTPKYAGIFGSSTSSAIFEYTGYYAGYFRGDVRVVNGTLYAYVSTPASSPNGGNVIAMPHDPSTEESVSNKLCEVQLLQTIMPSNSHKTGLEALANLAFDCDSTMSEDEKIAVSERAIEECSKLTVTNCPEPTVRYSLNPDQLKKVFPELVYEDNYGNVSINYVEMVPLLLQYTNELSAEVKELRAALAEYTGDKTMMTEANKRTETTATALSDAETDILSLDQNNPNPFSETTTIGVTVLETVKNAHIFIYDMSGKEIKRMEIAARGRTNVSVAGEDLISGMYLYSLIADGKVISTKRMILAK